MKFEYLMLQTFVRPEQNLLLITFAAEDSVHERIEYDSPEELGTAYCNKLYKLGRLRWEMIGFDSSSGTSIFKRELNF
jgi:hypothetical protein